MHVGYREAERSFPFGGPGPLVPAAPLHSTPPSLPSSLPRLLPFCPRACRIGTDSARLPTQNRCLSVSTPLPPSRPYAAGAQTGYVQIFSMRLRSLGTLAPPSEEHRVCLFCLFFLFERDSQRLCGHHRRRSGGATRVSQTDALRGILALVPARDTTRAFVCGASFGGPSGCERVSVREDSE